MPFFKKLDLRSWHVKPGTPGAYLLAAALVAAATAVRVAMGSEVLRGQFAVLFPPVIAATFLCGTAAGFFSVALSILCAWIFALPPLLLPVQARFQRIDLVLFVTAFASALVIITGALRSTIGQVRRLNQMFAQVFEENPDAILLSDQQGQIVNANQRAAAMFGKPRKALIGASIESLLPHRYRDRHVALHPAYMADPHPRPMAAGTDVFALRGDGTEFPVDVEIGPIQIDNENLAITTVRDITEHKTLYEELAESRQRQAVLEERQAGNRALRTALESTTDSVIVLDCDWRFIYLNQRAKAQNAQDCDLVG
jgi:PAS domain S-box-containing protein